VNASVTIRFWAGARRAAGRESEVVSAATMGELIALLRSRPELQSVCKASSYLLDGRAANESDELYDGAVVDVLPPFAGG